MLSIVFEIYVFQHYEYFDRLFNNQSDYIWSKYSYGRKKNQKTRVCTSAWVLVVKNGKCEKDGSFWS